MTEEGQPRDGALVVRPREPVEQGVGAERRGQIPRRAVRARRIGDLRRLGRPAHGFDLVWSRQPQIFSLIAIAALQPALITALSSP